MSWPCTTSHYRTRPEALAAPAVGYHQGVDHEISIDSGPGGIERVKARAGDFIYNPAHMVHREVTGPSEAEAFAVRIGSGPPNFNVEGPDPESAS